MAFTDEQRQALKAKLSYRHIKTRSSNGTSLPYVEGWHVIAEANRIFGYDCWDRRTVDPRCVWSELQRGQMVCFYTTKVRITVRAGGSTIVREGIGTGIGRSTTVEVAHDIALKSAETDATKRALATFGNPFGLALYDKDKLQVTKSRRASVARTPRASHQSNVPGDAKLQVVLTLNRGEGVSDRFESPTAYVDAILGLIPTLPTLESLYQFWESCHRQWETDPGGNMNLTHRIRWFLLLGGADAEGGGTDGTDDSEETRGEHPFAQSVDGSVAEYGAALPAGRRGGGGAEVSPQAS